MENITNEEREKHMEKELLNQIEEFDYEYFDELVKKVPEMKCEEIIKLHESLINKKYLNGKNVCNYGRRFMFKLLDYDYGYSIPKEIPQELIKFFNSQHTSDYFKNLIREYVKNPNEIVLNAINSDRNIAEFTVEEFYEIEEALNISNFYNAILSLAFKLNSEVASNFLNNKVNPITLIQRIVVTSGLNPRADYYSGRGARTCDLSGQTLMSIYNKLEKIDKNKALNMVKMTLSMPTLGATEFLESLYSLACNNYDLEKVQISTNNMSLGSTRDRERDVVAFASLASAFSGYRYDDTKSIKSTFMHFLPKNVVKEVCGESKSNANDIYGYNGYSRRRYR